jgi:hypothetical protein
MPEEMIERRNLEKERTMTTAHQTDLVLLNKSIGWLGINSPICLFTPSRFADPSFASRDRKESEWIVQRYIHVGLPRPPNVDDDRTLKGHSGMPAETE